MKGNISYSNIRIKFEDWPKLKTDNEMFEYRQMPVLGKDGKLYTKSNSILKLLGKEYDICINLTLDIHFIKQILINQQE